MNKKIEKMALCIKSTIHKFAIGEAINFDYTYSTLLELLQTLPETKIIFYNALEFKRKNLSLSYTPYESGPREGVFKLCGKTYDMKDFLKSRGWRWSPQDRCWAYRPLRGEDIFNKSSQFFDFLVYLFKSRHSSSIKSILQDPQLNYFYNFALYHHRSECYCLEDKSLSTCSFCRYGKLCCEKAKRIFCVCDRSTLCPDHGRRCIGSHS